MKKSSHAPFTPELLTPLGWRSPTHIDRECGAIMGRMLNNTATDADRELYEQLLDIRRRDLFTPRGEQPPQRRRATL